jgi:thiosulfate/3-mercaptopyruvate sulfurtransferase
MAGTHGPAIDDFNASHIKEAQYFDIDKIADQKTKLPHMAPTAADFESHMSDFGVSNGNSILCYDLGGNLTASGRVWWLFRLFGHDDVKIMHGAFSKDVFKDTPQLLEAGPAKSFPKGSFKAKFRPELVRSLDEVLANLNKNQFQLVDVRSQERFEGTVDEPRPNLFRGHIPGSSNIPWASLIKDGRLLPAEELRRLILGQGVDLNRPIVTSCGSGATAQILNIALATLGEDGAVYDGSWTDYGAVEKNLPYESGKK